VSQKKRFIAYYRVSTARQGASGLGLEAQKNAVKDFLAGGPGELSGEFLEIESGRRNDRPQLAAALQACRQHRATLVIAKLDRLARDAHFLLGLEKAGVEFVACDMPSANRLTIGILALVAEDEARAISARTKAALAAAKARGTVLGTPANLTNFELGIRNSAHVRMAAAQRRAHDLQPLIDQLKKGGISSASAVASSALTA
jgi:DNA invertase Pin-like site-specific DNA recombinase